MTFIPIQSQTKERSPTLLHVSPKHRRFCCHCEFLCKNNPTYTLTAASHIFILL